MNSPMALTAFFISGLSLLSPLHASSRSWHYLPTGNGHSFSVFDRQSGRITQFLEHPYRYVAPGNAARTFGTGRRDLAHDLYFGLSVNGERSWLSEGAEVHYQDQTHIIAATHPHRDAGVEVFYFSPFGFPGNALVMLAKVTNSTEASMAVTLVAKPNLKLGSGRPEPNDFGEQLTFVHGVGYETGPGGGHAVYAPLGRADLAGCGSDSNLYQRFLQRGDVPSTSTCTGNSLVLVTGTSAELAPGESLWWGQVILFANDTPNHPQRALFELPRTPQALLGEWQSFLNQRSAEELHADALAEFERWRVPRMPPQLDPTEQALFRQSEAVLRMGQVRERPGQNDGMILASLPPGEWHTGWLRDGAYGVAALAMLGHVEEARLGVEFYLGADAGFFNSPYFNWPDSYRVSTCRYFGNGMEETDFNHDGANIETDGWGLTLWAARMVLQYSCDFSWLEQPTWRGDTVFEALREVAGNIEASMVNDLPAPDASIWEVHWDRRQVFSYTAATQIRGLYDFAHIATAANRPEVASHYEALATRMLNAAKSALVYQPQASFASHQGVSGSEVHVDGSTVEFLHWGLVTPDDPLFSGTLHQYSRLQTGFGGYRRLEHQLSLTGESTANEYDLSEWVLLDLRIGDVWRRLGLTEDNSAYLNQAETLLSKVTAAAAANDNLVPELFDPNNGTYTGVVPMVGYGAGAWVMSQFEKYSAAAPSVTSSLAHCDDPCFPNPCTDPNQSECEVRSGVAACLCDAGYHFSPENQCIEDLECTPTTCAGHGACHTSAEGLTCECDPGYDGDRCEQCANGYRDSEQGCVSVQGESGSSTPESSSWNDGPASLCTGTGNSNGADLFLVLLVLLALLRHLRPHRGIALVLALLVTLPLTSPPAYAGGEAEVARFSEDRTPSAEWTLGWTGYVRMPVRFQGAPENARPPYLVDDDYFLSGFSYLPVNESEWAELFLRATRGKTEFVLGLLSSQLSDWSETTLQGQRGIALAFVDHRWDLPHQSSLSLRTGMFWDRDGYSPAYDTYLFGRTHVGGVRLSGTAFKHFYGRVGFGTHADVITSNQGFTPVAWGSVGVKLAPFTLSIYRATTWTGDSEREFSIVERGSLKVLGLQGSVTLPKTLTLSLTLTNAAATNVLFLANSFEMLHSTGGRGLTQNFLGNSSNNGTGEFQSVSWDLTTHPHAALTALGLPKAAAPLRTTTLRLFGMATHVKSDQSSSNPEENKDDRLYLKWGTEITVRPSLPLLGTSFASVRYDRVILDRNHNSLGFRVITPRIGLEPEEGLLIFASYSRYHYGENMRLRPNQIPGDVSVTAPDEHVAKIQATLSW